MAARQLFPYQDPLNQSIQVGTSGQTVILTVIGIGLNYFIEAVAYFAMPWQRTRE